MLTIDSRAVRHNHGPMLCLLMITALASAGCLQDGPPEPEDPHDAHDNADRDPASGDAGRPGAPGESGAPGEPGEPGQPSEGMAETVEIVLLDTEFDVFFFEPDTATIEMPEDAVEVEVVIRTGFGAYQGLFFQGLGSPCDDATTGQTNVVVGSNSGRIQTKCEAPPAGPYDVSWGVELGFVEGHVNVTAFVLA